MTNSSKEKNFQSFYLEQPRNGVYKSKKYIGKGINFVRMGDLFSNEFIDCDSQYQLINLTEKEKQNVLLKDGDLLFSRTSVVASGIGKCSLVLCKNDTEAVFDSNQIRVRLDSKIASPLFFYYFFKSDFGRNKLLSLAGGAAVTTITGKGISNTLVPDIDKNVQEKVSNLLYTYDLLIQNNNQRIALVEKIIHKIYTEWFINSNKLEKGILSDLVQIRRESVNPRKLSGNTPYIGIEHLPRESWTFTSFSKAEEAKSNKSKFFSGDILFGNIRPYFHKVLLSTSEGICSSDIVVITPREENLAGYVFSIIFSKQFINQATTSSKGTKMPRGNWDALLKYSVAIPPKSLLDEFQHVFSSLFNEATLLNKMNLNLVRTRDALIPGIVSGKLEIKS